MSSKQAVHVADLKAERPYLEGNPPSSTSSTSEVLARSPLSRC